MRQGTCSAVPLALAGKAHLAAARGSAYGAGPNPHLSVALTVRFTSLRPIGSAQGTAPQATTDALEIS